MEQLVLVTVSGPDPKLVKTELTSNSSAKDGQTRFSSTGLIFSSLPGIIITSLLPVYPFLQPQFRSRPSTISPTSNDKSNAGYNSQTTLLPGTRITCSFAGSSSCSSSTVQEVYLERTIGLEDVRSALRTILTAPSATRWSLGWGGLSNPNTELPLENQLDLASHVVVLKLPLAADRTRRSTTPPAIDSVIDNFASLPLGAQVTAHGCPFGALVSLKFHNFMISGAISALLERQEQQQSLPSPAISVVALSDLKFLPGMEGGVVYLNNTRKMIGILGTPLRAPEAHAELSVVISATAVQDAVRQNLLVQQTSSKPFSNPSTPNDIASTNIYYGAGISSRNNGSTHTISTNQERRLFNEALKAVVAVEAKNGWASGVLVSRHGHILTNAHALAPVSDSISTPRKLSLSIRVLVNKNWVAAEVLHVFSAPIDLAVLKIISNSNDRITLPAPAVLLGGSYKLKNGSSVAVAGYPLWRPSTGTRPLVTMGTAALMVPGEHADAPAVILTTADVHAGASGGAVLDLETGCVVGLVTSNTRLGRPRQQSLASPGQPPWPSRDKKNQPVLLFPHLNYCLGSAALDPVIQLLTAAEGSLQLDWQAVEMTLEESGVVEAWHSMRSMENLDIPNEQMKRKLPPALAALMKSKSGDGGDVAARPKL
ncbi:hypothetical protein Ndes2526B_g06372 [Nannochloris sp. 'desiccata']